MNNERQHKQRATRLRSCAPWNGVGPREPRGRRHTHLVRLRRRDGQSLVVFALVLPVLLGFCALVIDVGNLYVQKRSLQKSADAAALAAEQELTCPPSSCSADPEQVAATYSARNLGKGFLPPCAPQGAVPCYRYELTSTRGVRVQLRDEIPTLFGGLLGVNSVTITAKAAAGRFVRTSTTPGTSGAALMFAMSQTCNAISLTGANSQFKGAVVSNGGVNAPSNGIGGDLLVYGSGVSPTCLDVDPQGWTQIRSQAPVTWPVAPPTCQPAGACLPGSSVTPTFVNGAACNPMPVNPAVPGLYCSASEIKANELSPPHIGFAFVAPKITAGNGLYTGSSVLYPGYGGLVFYAYESDVTANGLEFKGAIFAPSGAVRLKGSGSAASCAAGATSCGFVEGLTVDLSGAGAAWQGLGPTITTDDVVAPVETTYNLDE